MTGGLCDALTGRSDGAPMLESLERGNLFVVALDDERRWYRYHHLFADAVRHGIASGDHEHAADLVELSLADMRRRRQDRILRDWLVALPEDVVRRRPLLAMFMVGAGSPKATSTGCRGVSTPPRLVSA